MAIIRWTDRPEVAKATRILDDLQKEVNRLFTGRHTGGATACSGVYPALNLSEDRENLVVRAELPGLGPDDVELSVEGETLTLAGDIKRTAAVEGVSYHRRERGTGCFRRVLSLPFRIDAEGVQAVFKNGVLKIVLPRAKETLPRKIRVSVHP